ncbi:hypothetical protein [Mycoplasmopsis primatum]|uniref:hypothetical protein n=1 Tax=Mycoplasmopsis primatum TaxID=55604 RepID=UPI0004954326|nr:hypothetical protein [Mycoplasmopsis primatum]
MKKAKKYAKALLILEGISAILLIVMIVLIFQAIAKAGDTNSYDSESNSLSQLATLVTASFINLFILFVIIAMSIAQLVLGILMAINCTENSGLQIFLWVSVIATFLGIGLLLFIAAIVVLVHKERDYNRPPIVAE